MNLAFRWFGRSDPVVLEHIRQIPGVHTVVSALYDVPVGEAWLRGSVAADALFVCIFRDGPSDGIVKTSVQRAKVIRADGRVCFHR